MRIVYETLTKKIERVIEQANEQGTRIEKIYLTEAEWRQFAVEMWPTIPVRYMGVEVGREG